MNYAVAVGCSAYADPEIAALKYGERDALSLADAFRIVVGVRGEHVISLPSSTHSLFEPTRSNIIRALSPPHRGARMEAENLYFFFSGHGFHSSRTDKDYLIPKDAVAASLDETALAIETVVQLLRRWGARNTVLFLDVCRAALWSGKSIEVLSAEPLRQDARISGFATFWSCSPGERSFECDAVERGVFSTAVLEGLSDIGKCKTIYELGSYLTTSVPTICRKHSLPVQNPYLVVEPIDIQSTTIVSSETLRRWQSSMPIGREVRNFAVSPLVDDRGNIDAPIICGIDFGTSHSAVTVCDNQRRVVFVPFAANRALLPSVVAFLPDLTYYVGPKAIEYSLLDPASVVFDVKRYIGTNRVFNIHGRSFRPEEIASLIIASLKANLEAYLQTPISSALASAPANFTMNQCTALLRAYELAGIRVIRLVGEPAAAGLVAQLAAQREDTTDETCLVLDLGGGTFDVSVFEIGSGVWEVKASGGDRELGGIDYDHALLDYLEHHFSTLTPANPITDLERSQLRREAERAKILLGSSEQTSVVLRDVEVPGEGIRNLEATITRATFKEIARELDQRVSDCISSTLKDAGLQPSQVDRVILAGQGTKLFTLREMIRQTFSGVPIAAEHQENAVALGMGRYLYTLKYQEKGKGILLLDALPTALGVKCRDNDCLALGYDCEISDTLGANPKTSIILDKDTTIPTRKSLDVRIHSEHSVTVELSLVEIDSRGKDVEFDLGGIEVHLSPGDTRDISMRADVDANRTIVIYGGFSYWCMFIEKGGVRNSERLMTNQVVVERLPAAPGIHCSRIDESTGTWFVSRRSEDNILSCPIKAGDSGSRGRIEAGEGTVEVEIVDLLRTGRLTVLPVSGCGPDSEFIISMRKDEGRARIALDVVAGEGTFMAQLNNPMIDAHLPKLTQRAVRLRPPRLTPTVGEVVAPPSS